MKMMFFAILAAYLGGNAYIFVRSLQAFASVPLMAKILFAVIFWIASLSLVVAMLMRDVAVSPVLMKVLNVVGSAWLVFALYMVIALLCVDVVRCLIPSLRYGFGLALTVTLCVLGYGYYNYRHPRVNELEISLENPISGDALRIVAVSDIHLGYATGKARLKEYVELINSQNPDLILIIGDLIDNNVRPLYEELMAEELSQLRASQGIYMVPGNHEYISGIKAVEEFVKQTPITLLRDTVVTLPCGLQIVGRDDRFNLRRRPLADIMSLVDQAKPTIMLDHQPYDVAKKDSLAVDVQLSGHTHHGQVFPMNLLTDSMYEQSHGYRRWQHSHVYVSSGLSLWGPPFRIGTYSELLLLTIK